jgi:hypothetical protein
LALHVFAVDVGVKLRGGRGQYEWAFCMLYVPVSHLIFWSPKHLEMVAVLFCFHCELDFWMYIVKILM